jgi:hypothetical protein
MIERFYLKSPILGAQFTLGGKFGVNEAPHGIILLDVKGLGPSPVSINTISGLNAPSNRFNSKKPDNRNIVLTIVNTDPEFGDSDAGRNLLYYYLSTGRRVTLGAVTGDLVREIDGYVESFELNMFSKNENAEVSIICPDIFFKEVPSITAHLEPYPSSNIMLPGYRGHVDSSPRIRLFFTGTLNDHFRVYNHYTPGFMMFNRTVIETIIGRQVLAGDHIDIKTAYGKKQIEHVDSSYNRTNILASLTADSSWLYVAGQLLNSVVWHPTPINTGLQGYIIVNYDVLYSGV